jgi:hypothetical protein
MGFCLLRDVSGSGSVPTLPEPRTRRGALTGLQWRKSTARRLKKPGGRTYSRHGRQPLGLTWKDDLKGIPCMFGKAGDRRLPAARGRLHTKPR